ncbi:Uncharacterized protein TCM_002211 [Theobroma cacao]|uniref:Uncharacterized protein n=1 Tax=Theobroma cacao TaxID=3641 RepID=A0A061DKY8_THECC|nr:Uncharacterized protein TCM_002211 [Theobroma cacao]
MKKGERYDWQGADAPCQAPLSPARREFFASGRVVERPLQSPEVGYKWEGENLQQREGTCSKGGTSFLSNGKQPENQKNREGELGRKIEKRGRGVLLPAQEEGAPNGGRERGAAAGAAPEREERRLARHQICK